MIPYDLLDCYVDEVRQGRMSMNGGLMPIRINVAVVANLKVERCVSCGQRMIPLIRGLKCPAAKASLLANHHTLLSACS